MIKYEEILVIYIMLLATLFQHHIQSFDKRLAIICPKLNLLNIFKTKLKTEGGLVEAKYFTL